MPQNSTLCLHGVCSLISDCGDRPNAFGTENGALLHTKSAYRALALKTPPASKRGGLHLELKVHILFRHFAATEKESVSDVVRSVKFVGGLHLSRNYCPPPAARSR